MITYVVRRLAISLVTLVGISMALFGLLRLVPGDPVSMYFNPLEFNGNRAAAIAQMRHQLGLDRPLPVQYVSWLRELTHGNLGVSIETGRPVAELMGSRIGATAYLMGSGLVIALVIGISGGVVAALRRNSGADYAISTVSLAVVSIPAFFLALVAIYVFGLKLDVLPTAGINDPGGGWGDAFRHLVLPAGILGLSGAAGYARWSRSSMLDVLGQDFLVTARSKGLSPIRIVLRHAFHNALIPLVTIVAMNIPGLFGGAVIIEDIFAWPGMGLMAVDAIANRDYSVLMGFVMATVILVLACNLLADLAYAAIDPRVRLR